MSWAISERADKDRFFREPGYIIGISVTRPKVYLKNQQGALVDYMNNANMWLPAIMRDDPYTSLVKWSATTGPAEAVVTDSDGYWVDIKDLFIYGDQFVNVALSGTGLNAVSLPTAAMQTKYVTSTDVNGFFVGTTDADRVVSQDGVVQLSVLGALDDTTPVMRRMV